VSGGYQGGELLSGPTGVAIREEQQHRVSQPAVLPAGHIPCCTESTPALKAIERQYVHAPVVQGVLDAHLEGGPTAITHRPGAIAHKANR
jgi:hypothetical protein